jgi:uncharacterized protein YdbL (DUF1318 family)
LCAPLFTDAILSDTLELSTTAAGHSAGAGAGAAVRSTEFRVKAAEARAEVAEARAEAFKKLAADATARAADATARMRQLGGDPEALRGCRLDELRALVAEIEQGRNRAREALEQAESARAQDLAKNLIDNLACCICLERRKDTALGCGYVLCEPCAGLVQQCPTCRLCITECKRVYL